MRPVAEYKLVIYEEQDGGIAADLFRVHGDVMVLEDAIGGRMTWYEAASQVVAGGVVEN